MWDLPEELLIAVFSAALPLPWFFGAGIVVCKKFAELAMWAKKKRVAKEQNKVTQAVGGYQSENVTTICLFYKLLSYLRSNSVPRLELKDHDRLILILDVDNIASINAVGYRHATSEEWQTIVKTTPWSFVKPVKDPFEHDLLSKWLEAYDTPNAFIFRWGPFYHFIQYSQSLVRETRSITNWTFFGSRSGLGQRHQ